MKGRAPSLWPLASRAQQKRPSLPVLPREQVDCPPYSATIPLRMCIERQLQARQKPSVGNFQKTSSACRHCPTGKRRAEANGVVVPEAKSTATAGRDRKRAAKARAGLKTKGDGA